MSSSEATTESIFIHHTITKNERTETLWQKFVIGGFSNQVACLFVTPLETIKTRLQLQGQLAAASTATVVSYKYKGLVRGSLTIAREEGAKGLWKGLGPSLLREATYSSLRLGGYEVGKNALGCKDPKTTPIWKKIVAGGTAGAIGAAIANPTDLLKVRLQADTTGRYGNCVSAFVHIYREEGVRAFWRGTVPTTQRAAIMTATQLSTYDHSKHKLLNAGFREGVYTHFLASLGAGFICAIVTSPVDVVKTRVMAQIRNANSIKLYNGSLDCFQKTFRAEGWRGFYKGFFPTYFRMGMDTTLTFLVLEQTRKLLGIKPL